MSQVDIKALIANVDALPALPGVAAQALAVFNNPKATHRDLADIISTDQSLVAGILKLANSAYYGFSRKIATVNDAIVLLGFNTIRSLILASTVKDRFSQPVPGYSLAAGEMWKHSIVCAMTARNIARRVKFASPEEAFVAGLLHDIGKLILNLHVGQLYREILEQVSTGKVTFNMAEQQFLGADHAEVGAKVAEKWNLPSELVDTIGNHHLTGGAGNLSQLTAIVHVADALCLMLGIGLGGDGLLYSLSQEAIHFLGLDQSTIDRLMLEISDYLQDYENFS